MTRESIIKKKLWDMIAPDLKKQLGVYEEYGLNKQEIIVPVVDKKLDVTTTTTITVVLESVAKKKEIKENAKKEMHYHCQKNKIECAYIL